MELLAFSQSSKRGIEKTTTTVNSTAEINSAVNAASLISPLPEGTETGARQGPNRYPGSSGAISSRNKFPSRLVKRGLDRVARVVGIRLALKVVRSARGPDG